jgi:CheY-like chemotaxis protein
MGDENVREVLLVEDSPGDAALAREAFAEAGVAVNLRVVTDGVEALNYLRGIDSYSEREVPDMVLLDLKLPRKSGLQVLEETKEDPDLRRIPVVVLTTSTAERDVSAAYRLHANSYLRKPVTFEEFVRLARTIGDYWLGLVRLPKAADIVSDGGMMAPEDDARA